jgi:hypothetical protein
LCSDAAKITLHGETETLSTAGGHEGSTRPSVATDTRAHTPASPLHDGVRRSIDDDITAKSRE